MALRLAGDGQEELEFWGKLVLGIEAVREIDAADTAVGVNLNSKVKNLKSQLHPVLLDNLNALSLKLCFEMQIEALNFQSSLKVELLFLT